MTYLWIFVCSYAVCAVLVIAHIARGNAVVADRIRERGYSGDFVSRWHQSFWRLAIPVLPRPVLVFGTTLGIATSLAYWVMHR